MVGTIYGFGAVIFPGEIGKSMVTMNSNNLGSIDSSRKFTGLIFRLINFHNWSNLAWVIKLLSQPSQLDGLIN